jgi:predicted ATPase
LYSAIPEIEQIVKMIWPDMLETSGACDVLGSVESSVRFQNLVCDLVSELGASRMVVFVLDDLHNADPSSLSMIEAFARGRVGVLVVATLRASHT